jgi:hypothetical protein
MLKRSAAPVSWLAVDVEPERLRKGGGGLTSPPLSLRQGHATSQARPCKERAHGRVVALDEVAPPSVSELGQSLGRADDVGEKDRREHPVEVGLLGIHAREEALDFADERVRMGCPGEVIEAG